jgi:Na+-transporting NADH:ubiquinone oxidoreductase subunit NqrF
VHSRFDIGVEYRRLGHVPAFVPTSTSTEAVFRAYSMANFPLESDIIMLNVRGHPPPRTGITAGIVAHLLHRATSGDSPLASSRWRNRCLLAVARAWRQ